MPKVTSADGTTIAYEVSGAGSPVILVGGALNVAASTRPLAQALEHRYTVVSYDRRGRGASTDTSPYDVAREVDDIAALLTALGGQAAVFGFSSGAALVVEAAAAGLPITKVVLQEPPYAQDDAEPNEGGPAVLRFLADGRHREAVETFLTMAGMPADAAVDLAAQPGMADLAPTLAHDFAVMGNATPGGTVPYDLIAKVTQPTLVIYGSASPPFMIDAARSIANALSDGQQVELQGHQHVVPPEVLGPVVEAFLA
ncbi:alpha/beta hydrolase [Kribbella qitaiheensis]|uniref:Alpha/beta hydrolase n=1 Tax=Kribbella qitaiheensis TaxID=1544730 RepID=A0A7G6WXZ1_9ACTN|nr:alpha/beta hydrolase [Kribbella qitaiheensis]QNE18856.1 alpha/beta hydrolase [Kribbella qitaiheensis]